MLKKRILIGIFVLLIVALFPSVSAEDIFYNGDLGFNLENNYSAGDTINTEIKISNSEDFPIADAYLVIELVKGCETPTYPSQISDCDNIIDESVIDKVNIPANSNINMPYSYNLPSNLKSGIYRMDVYLRTKITPIVGMPHVHMPGKFQTFNVSGSGDFPYAKILRTKTNIKNKTGPIGAGVKSGKEFELNIYINSKKIKNAILSIDVCDWEDSACEPIIEKEEQVRLTKGEQIIPIKLNAPEKSSAYAIRIELKDSKIVSLYRSRIVVFGKTARIRKLHTNDYYYNEGDKVNVLTLLAGSPDHYNYPSVEDIILKAWITDLVKDEKVDERSFEVGTLDKDNFFSKKSFEFEAPNKLTEFQVCSEAKSSNKVYDKYCYIINANNFESNSHEIELIKNNTVGQFKGELCVKDKKTNLPTKADLFYLIENNKSELIKTKRKTADNCLDIEFNTKKEVEYNINVQDKTTNENFNFNIMGTETQKKEGFSKLFIIVAGILTILIIVVLFLLIKGWRRNEN